MYTTSLIVTNPSLPHWSSQLVALSCSNAVKSFARSILIGLSIIAKSINLEVCIVLASCECTIVNMYSPMRLTAGTIVVPLISLGRLCVDKYFVLAPSSLNAHTDSGPKP